MVTRFWAAALRAEELTRPPGWGASGVMRYIRRLTPRQIHAQVVAVHTAIR